MRVHRLHPYLDLWRDASSLRRVVSAQTLIAARMEPAMRLAGGFATLDFTFARDGEIAVVPLVIVDGAMLAEQERSPLIWPKSAGDALSDACALSIEERVVPWLLSHFLASRLCRELIRTYDEAASDAIFARARLLGFLGAAPYERAMIASAPYAYGARFASGRSVCIRDATAAATGAAMLTRHARSVVADIGSDDNAFAREWYASDVFGGVRFDDAYDVAIGDVEALPDARVRIATRGPHRGIVVPIARPVPCDVMVSFDLEDSEPAGAFSVEAPRVELRPGIAVPTAIGGSSGRILFAVRDDAMRAGDADTDAAFELARRLRGEGFTVDVCGAEDARPQGYDLLHAFTLGAMRDLGALLDRAETAGVPIVATPHLDDISKEGVWGPGIIAGAHRVALDGDRDAHLGAIARRRLRADAIDPKGTEPYAGYREALRANLARCGVAIVEGPAEERFLRDALGYRGHVAIVAPTLHAYRAADDIGALVGDADFVFAHAAIEARSNLLLLAHAAMRGGFPLVVAGPVLDAETLAVLREIGDERIVTLTAASDAQIVGLYRRARVFADVAWSERGSARMACAALGGAAVVAASALYGAELLRPGVWPVDRASVDAIGAGLAAAWGAGSERVAAGKRRASAWCDPVLALAGVAEAYARAQPAAVAR